MHEDRRLLRLGLLGNSAFSLVSGLLLAIAPRTVGDWLGVDIDGWLRSLGVALIGHAAVLTAIARQPRPDVLARVNVAMIAPYPLAMVALVLSGAVDRGLGQALVLADGALVALLAVVQVSGIRRSVQQTVPLLL